MSTKVDKCRLCRSNEAKWICLDDKMHTYWELELTRRLKLELKGRKQQDAYIVCRQCRRQIERLNSRSKWPRGLKFLPWS